MADPGVGNFRLNNADPSLATQMAISSTNVNGLDVSIGLEHLGDGDAILLQESQDSSRSEAYGVNGDNTDNGTWLQVPIVFDSAGAGNIRANKTIAFTFFFSSSSSAVFSTIQTASLLAGKKKQQIRVKQDELGFELHAQSSLNYSYTGENGDGAEAKAASYETVSCFIFQGSDALAVISAIKAVISADGSISGDIRIFDVTNSNVIAELTTFTNSTPVLTDLGAITNVPTDPAVFEVQMLRDGTGGDRVLLCAVQVEF